MEQKRKCLKLKCRIYLLTNLRSSIRRMQSLQNTLFNFVSMPRSEWPAVNSISWYANKTCVIVVCTVLHLGDFRLLLVLLVIKKYGKWRRSTASTELTRNIGDEGNWMLIWMIISVAFSGNTIQHHNSNFEDIVPTDRTIKRTSATAEHVVLDYWDSRFGKVKLSLSLCFSLMRSYGVWNLAVLLGRHILCKFMTSVFMRVLCE